MNNKDERKWRRAVVSCEKLSKLISQGMTLNPSQGRTPLNLVLEIGSYASVELLLKAGAKPNILGNASDENDFFMAVSRISERLACLKLLMEYAQGPEYQDEIEAAKSKLLRYSIEEGAGESVIRYLLDQGAGMDYDVPGLLIQNGTPEQSEWIHAVIDRFLKRSKRMQLLALDSAVMRCQGSVFQEKLAGYEALAKDFVKRDKPLAFELSDAPQFPARRAALQVLKTGSVDKMRFLFDQGLHHPKDTFNQESFLILLFRYGRQDYMYNYSEHWTKPNASENNPMLHFLIERGAYDLKEPLLLRAVDSFVGAIPALLQAGASLTTSGEDGYSSVITPWMLAGMIGIPRAKKLFEDHVGEPSEAMLVYDRGERSSARRESHLFLNDYTAFLDFTYELYEKGLEPLGGFSYLLSLGEKIAEDILSQGEAVYHRLLANVQRYKLEPGSLGVLSALKTALQDRRGAESYTQIENDLFFKPVSQLLEIGDHRALLDHELSLLKGYLCLMNCRARLSAKPPILSGSGFHILWCLRSQNPKIWLENFMGALEFYPLYQGLSDNAPGSVSARVLNAFQHRYRSILVRFKQRNKAGFLAVYNALYASGKRGLPMLPAEIRDMIIHALMPSYYQGNIRYQDFGGDPKAVKIHQSPKLEISSGNLWVKTLEMSQIKKL